MSADYKQDPVWIEQNAKLEAAPALPRGWGDRLSTSIRDIFH